MAAERHLTKWDDWILRFIAIYHLLKALFFYALGFGLIHLLHLLNLHYDFEQFLRDYVIEPFHLDPDDSFLNWLQEKINSLTPHSLHQLRFFSYVFFGYGSIFAIEGIGLYLRKRWAEYMVVIVVSSLLPFEIYEIYLKLALWKVLLIVGNLLVVGFLIHRLRIETAEKHK